MIIEGLGYFLNDGEKCEFLAQIQRDLRRVEGAFGDYQERLVLWYCEHPECIPPGGFKEIEPRQILLEGRPALVSPGGMFFDVF